MSRLAVAVLILNPVVALLCSSVAHADEPAVYRFETTVQSAGNYHGSILGISSDVRMSPTFKLLPRADNLTRTFDGGPSFNETTLTMGAAQNLTKSIYLLGAVSATPNAQLNPQWAANLDPHYAFGSSDFGFRVAYASYVDQQAAIFTPSYLYSVTDSFLVSDAVSAVRSDNWYVANSTQLIYKPNQRTSFRLIPAFGQTLESAGAPAQFTSTSVEGSARIAKHVRLGVGGTAYKSTLRTENSILLRLEVW